MKRDDILDVLRKFKQDNAERYGILEIGVFGFLLLLSMVFLPVFPSIRQGQYLYVIFLLIFALNMVFESMLEIQAGVVFYSFFNSFFFWTRKKNYQDTDLIS